jgi:hypothetical protein
MATSVKNSFPPKVPTSGGIFRNHGGSGSPIDTDGGSDETAHNKRVLNAALKVTPMKVSGTPPKRRVGP